jgi:hypothetical protein
MFPVRVESPSLGACFVPHFVLGVVVGDDFGFRFAGFTGGAPTGEAGVEVDEFGFDWVAWSGCAGEEDSGKGAGSSDEGAAPGSVDAVATGAGVAAGAGAGAEPFLLTPTVSSPRMSGAICSLGRGMTWQETTFPVAEAATVAASTAALIAPTSPSSRTTTMPPPFVNS